MVGYERDLMGDYFEWLCNIAHADQGDRSYWLLMKDLHRRTFYALVPHDENRASDGIELREEYMREEMWYPKYASLEGECTMLEMLLGLARRIDFKMSDPYNDDAPDQTAFWFWEMVDNLGLLQFTDEDYVALDGFHHVDDIIDRFLERDYRPDGEGGIFPLRKAYNDQRDVEIWFQMSAYLSEREAG